MTSKKPIKALKTIFLIVFVATGTVLFAQATFTQSYGTADYYERGNSVMQIPDGGYIITGRTVRFGSGGGVNAYLVRVDKNGKMLWEKSFGGKGSEEGLSVRATDDGGYIIAGFTNSFGAGAADVYLVKTKADGSEEWSKTYGGTGIDKAHSVKQTRDGGYIITGETYSFGNGWVNCYLIRTNEKGDTLWTKVYGGNGIEEGNSVFETADGGFVITGATNSFGAGDYDVYLIRTDSKGNMLWMQAFGGSGPERGLCVEEARDGGFILSGYTESFGSGGVDIYLIKTNAKGEQEWVNTFGGKTDEYGNCVVQTRDDGFAVCGSTNSYGKGGTDVYLLDITKEGEMTWSKTYGTSTDESANCLQQTLDGGYVMVGSAVKFSENGQNSEKVKDVYLVKTGPRGQMNE
ncbi:MAG: hypothetical protein ACE5DN_03180 [Flavobacteriales bacterium]